MILSNTRKQQPMQVIPLTAAASFPSSVDPLLVSFLDLFTFSPFGLGCRRCKKNCTIQLDKRCISRHLKRHGMNSTVATVCCLLDTFKTFIETAKASGTIEPYRSDKNVYLGYSCICGQVIPRRNDNAIRHCQKQGCDASKLQTVQLIKLCCGRYVTPAQVASFFNDAPCITQQFDYQQARAILLPFLPKKEKQDHTYTHMYVPLIAACDGGNGFTEKIKADFVSIHSSPCKSGESMLITIQ